jgi:hypothetical protein
LGSTDTLSLHEQTPMRRVHPLTYQVAQRYSERPLKLHQRRDLVATLELEYALFELGYRHGEHIFNQPPPGGPRKPPEGQTFPVDVSFVEEGDLLLQTMRPPMNDIHAGGKRIIARAYTDLEELLFLALGPFLSYSARTHMRLSSRMRKKLGHGFENRREMSFAQRGWGAAYDTLNDTVGGGWRKFRGSRRTALFLIHLPQAWKGGPGFLCAFGMDGCTTCIFAYRLARDLKHLLLKPGFVVCELELGEMPQGSTDLRWCMDLKIEPILMHEIPFERPLANANG